MPGMELGYVKGLEDVTDLGLVFIALGAIFVLLFVFVTLRGDRKRCPECDQVIRGKANVCRHCGHRFDAPARIEGG